MSAPTGAAAAAPPKDGKAKASAGATGKKGSASRGTAASKLAPTPAAVASDDLGETRSITSQLLDESETRSQIRSEIMSTAGSAVAAPRTGGAPSGVSAGKGGAKSGGRGGAGGGPGAGGGGKRKGAAAAAAAAALDDTASTGTRDEILRESAALEAEFREQMSPSAGGKGKALSTTAAPWEPSGALPPHACAYCTAHNPSSVVRCVRTGKWFCNGRGGTSGAHIVQHLVRSKCKEVCLHPESPLGDAVLECYNCGCRNVFLLGFIPSKTQTGVVVLLCREPCLNLEALKDAGWDLSLWQPIIEDRAFLPWLVHVPSKEEEAAARPVSAAQITGIEMLWRKKPDAGWTEFLAHGAGGGADGGADGASGAEASGAGGEGEPAPAPVLLRYEDGYEYQNLFGPLVKAEADESKLMTESLRQDGVAVRWESAKEGASAAGAAAGAAAGSGGSGGGGGVAGGGGKRVLAHFRFARPDSELRLLAGDEMRLKLPSLATQLGISGLVSAAVSSAKGAAGAAAAAAGKGAKTSGGGSAAEDEDAAWVGTGVVRGVADGEVTVEITSHSGGSKADGIPLGTTAGFIVELVWRSVTFDRMQAALRTFATDERSVSIFLYHALLGHPLEPTVLPVALPAEIKAPRLPALNASQEAAVRTVLQRPLSLIQGPPGTGKTVTSATIVYHLCQQKQGQVLVAAPSNVAVDHLTEKIAATGLKVVRVAARAREGVSTSVDHLCLHSMVDVLGAATKPELKRLLGAKEERGILGAGDEGKLKRLLREVEHEILSNADVITTTCAGAGDRRLEGMRFKQVLVDEATQACEPESLIPIVKGAKQLVLVGDHCQLGPVIMSKAAAGAGLSQSLFERLIMLGVRPLRLQVQYRMHPCLSEFPSNTFYEGSLSNGVTLAERACRYDIPWPQPARPMFFYNSTGAEEISASGTSFLNRGEAVMVERIVTAFLNAGVTPEQIGVITPYEGQKAYTMAYMVQHGALRSALYQAIEVASVDSFQGREKDYVILSCVRSNEHQGIGFLNDPRRLNVALTRARFGVAIVGNPRVLAKQPLWHLLISHFQAQRCLVDGPLAALTEVKLALPPPRTQYAPRTNALLKQAMADHAAADAADAAAAGGWAAAAAAVMSAAGKAGAFDASAYHVAYPSLAAAAGAGGVGGLVPAVAAPLGLSGAAGGAPGAGSSASHLPVPAYGFHPGMMTSIGPVGMNFSAGLAMAAAAAAHHASVGGGGLLGSTGGAAGGPATASGGAAAAPFLGLPFGLPGLGLSELAFGLHSAGIGMHGLAAAAAAPSTDAAHAGGKADSAEGAAGSVK